MTFAVVMLAALVPGVQIDGVWLDAEAARARGLVLAETRRASEADGCTELVLTLRNASDATVRPEELGWRKEGRDDFDVGGLKVYLESWQMASPCGVRSWDDAPFDYSPDYLRHCVSTPADFRRGEQGAFLSDHQCCFRRPDGALRLYGFTTGRERFGHFRMRLAADGVREFFALCACDRAELRPGAEIVSERLVAMDGADTEALFGRYADRWAADSGARRRFAAPVGWCSWYYYFDKVTLADVVANADWLRAHRAEGFDRVRVIQLDDGYQAALGDWLVPNAKFPGGLKRFADEVRARGFTPAVWVGPFMAEENSRLFAEHPEWMVQGADGRPAVAFGWRDDHAVYALDGTNPAVQAHLRALFRTLRGYGIDYVKLDFCMLASSVPDARYFDPTATRAQALRRAFEAIREGFGEDGFILGCTAPFGPLVGIVDAMRSSTDITPYWRGEGHQHAEAPTVPNVCRNVINHNYLNGRLWLNDPDTLIVRDEATKLTEDEVRLWAEAVAQAGGSLLLADNFRTLSAPRLQLAQEVVRRMNRTQAYPADRWAREYPAVWVTRVDGRRVRTVFNLGDEPLAVEGTEVPPHTARRLPAKGCWREEAGIRKYVVGRDAAAGAAEAKAAYGRPVGGRVWHVDETMTLDEVNELEVLPGDRVLFRRGGVWRGQLQPRSGQPGHPVTYGAYGTGEKPVLQPSYARTSPDDWRRAPKGDGGPLWRAETGASADIGNVIFAAAGAAPRCGGKRNTLAEVRDDLDFWCDPETFAVYLRSDVNPAERFATVELCEKAHCIEEAKMHDVVYDGLALRYSAAHGIGGDGVSRITVRNCDISWIGGGYLYHDRMGNGVRYGNGIEFWANCADVLVESNRVWECWDAALTNQSSEDGAVQRNVVWRGNEVWNCEYSYEYWQQGNRARTENVVVEHNVFRDAGRGWGHRQRWNPNAAHLMFYDTTAETSGFVVRSNLFARSENTLFRLFNDWRRELAFEGNTWVSAGEPICRFHGRPTANLVYRYPDRLDQMHDDNLAEIEAQTVTPPRVIGADGLEEFRAFLRAGRKVDMSFAPPSAVP
ncbi:MAG: alpha-galactosidase [Kiritimatiellia bacterium]